MGVFSKSKDTSNEVLSKHSFVKVCKDKLDYFKNIIVVLNDVFHSRDEYYQRESVKYDIFDSEFCHE